MWSNKRIGAAILAVGSGLVLWALVTSAWKFGYPLRLGGLQVIGFVLGAVYVFAGLWMRRIPELAPSEGEGFGDEEGH